MKKSFEIINHLKNQPQLKKIKTYECLNKLRSLLPLRFQNAIQFMYIKNSTLFFALNHPGYKMEFNYNHNLIKRVLKELKKSYLQCEDIEIKSIKVFVTNQIYQKDKTTSSKIFYKERAKGEFEIKTDNEKLKKIWLNIQKIIKSHS